MNQKSESPSNEDVWRIFRIMAEFVDGFDQMSKLGPCITVFGSARTNPGSPYYVMAQKVAALAVKKGFGVITGGGPGIMEAANKGASEAKGVSVGLNIQLPFEQKPNPHIRKLINFQHFFCRKVLFLKYTSGVIVLPGGFGTMDELFEVLTLLQTHKISSLPLIMMGAKFWRGLQDWLNNSMLANGYLESQDVRIPIVTDDPSVAMKVIIDAQKKRITRSNFD